MRYPVKKDYGFEKLIATKKTLFYVTNIIFKNNGDYYKVATKTS